MQEKLHKIVKIKEIDREGIIEEISLSINGISYRVSYWNNGERHSIWMTSQEIEE